MKNRIMTLGEISIFIRNGITIKQNNQEKKGYPITRIETISNSTIDKNRMGYAGIFEKEKYQNWFLENEDILISHINSEKHLGKSAIYFGDKEKIIHGMNLLCFRTKKEIVNSQYLYFYFKSLNYKKKIGKIAKKSVNQASFSIKDFRDIEIELPNIEDQKIIIKKLKIIYEILRLKKEQIKSLSELSKCLFSSILSNEEKENYKKINELFEIIDGDRGKNYPKPNELYEEEYCLFLNTGNVTKNGFCFGKTVFITKEKDDILRNGKLRREDIVLTTRGTVGNLAYYDENIKYDNIRINSGMVILRRTKEINPIFFIYSFKETNDYIKSISGSAQPQLPIVKLKATKVLFVPIELQNKFAERIKLIEKSKFEIQQSIDETQKLFDSLMEKYFG